MTEITEPQQSRKDHLGWNSVKSLFRWDDLNRPLIKLPNFHLGYLFEDQQHHPQEHTRREGKKTKPQNNKQHNPQVITDSKTLSIQGSLVR